MKVKNILRAVARFTRAKEAVSALEYAIVVGVVVAGVGGRGGTRLQTWSLIR